jgi:hypothetical protein
MRRCGKRGMRVLGRSASWFVFGERESVCCVCSLWFLLRCRRRVPLCPNNSGPYYFQRSRHKVFRGGRGRGPPILKMGLGVLAPPKNIYDFFFEILAGAKKKTGQTVDFPITILCYVRRNKEPDWSESPQSQ